MEINYPKLKTLIGDSALEDYAELEFEGLTSFVMYDDTNSGNPVQYDCYGDHYVIYIWESIEKDFRKPIVLHEIAETFLNRLYENCGMSPDEAKIEAHEEARKLDEKYARETFYKETFERYLKFRDSLINPLN